MVLYDGVSYISKTTRFTEASADLSKAFLLDADLTGSRVYQNVFRRPLEKAYRRHLRLGTKNSDVSSPEATIPKTGPSKIFDQPAEQTTGLVPSDPVVLLIGQNLVEFLDSLFHNVMVASFQQHYENGKEEDLKVIGSKDWKDQVMQKPRQRSHLEQIVLAAPNSWRVLPGKYRSEFESPIPLYGLSTIR